MPFDVTSEAEVERARALVDDAPTVLVNAAGVFDLASVAQTDGELLRRNLEVNLVGTVNVTRTFLPAMLAARLGVVINVGSVAGWRAFPEKRCLLRLQVRVARVSRRAARRASRHPGCARVCWSRVPWTRRSGIPSIPTRRRTFRTAPRCSDPRMWPMRWDSWPGFRTMSRCRCCGSKARERRPHRSPRLPALRPPRSDWCCSRTMCRIAGWCGESSAAPTVATDFRWRTGSGICGRRRGGPGRVGAVPLRRARASTRALRLAAALGVTEGPGMIVVPDARHDEAPALARLVRGIEVVVVGWRGQGAGRRRGERLRDRTEAAAARWGGAGRGGGGGGAGRGGCASVSVC